MAHDVPAFAALATDRDVYVYDRIGTGASSRLADPMGYTTARAVQDLEAVRLHTERPGLCCTVTHRALSLRSRTPKNIQILLPRLS